MTRDDLRNDLQPVIGKLEELEARARKLQNQNLADVIAGAHGKIKQFCEHPDAHLVLESDKPSEPVRVVGIDGGLPFGDPNVDPNVDPNAPQGAVRP